MQRGLGEAARSWGGSAVLGVSPMSDCRGLPHERLPWFPRGLQGADAGSAHRPKTMSDCIKTRPGLLRTNPSLLTICAYPEQAGG